MAGGTMKAVVIREAGGPEVLKLENRPIPQPQAGQVMSLCLLPNPSIKYNHCHHLQ